MITHGSFENERRTQPTEEKSKMADWACATASTSGDLPGVATGVNEFRIKLLCRPARPGGAYFENLVRGLAREIGDESNLANTEQVFF